MSRSLEIAERYRGLPRRKSQSRFFLFDFRSSAQLESDLAMIHPQGAPYLPDDIWRALLQIRALVNTLPMDSISKRILCDGIESLAIQLAEVAKQHSIRYPIGG
jgi:hypothetical protein